MYNILNNPQLGELEIIEVYEYFNMPLLFSCKNLIWFLLYSFMCG